VRERDERDEGDEGDERKREKERETERDRDTHRERQRHTERERDLYEAFNSVAGVMAGVANFVANFRGGVLHLEGDPRPDICTTTELTRTYQLCVFNCIFQLWQRPGEQGDGRVHPAPAPVKEKSSPGPLAGKKTGGQIRTEERNRERGNVATDMGRDSFFVEGTQVRE
jgi:hypothetical protein